MTFFTKLKAQLRERRSLISSVNISLEQYFNLCKTVVENEGNSLFYADDEELNKNQYLELCEISFNSFYGNIQFINNEKIPANLYHKWYNKALDENPVWINKIPYTSHYYSYCLKTVKKNGKVLEKNIFLVLLFLEDFFIAAYIQYTAEILF